MQESSMHSAFANLDFHVQAVHQDLGIIPDINERGDRFGAVDWNCPGRLRQQQHPGAADRHSRPGCRCSSRRRRRADDRTRPLGVVRHDARPRFRLHQRPRQGWRPIRSSHQPGRLQRRRSEHLATTSAVPSTPAPSRSSASSANRSPKPPDTDRVVGARTFGQNSSGVADAAQAGDRFGATLGVAPCVRPAPAPTGRGRSSSAHRTRPSTAGAAPACCTCSPCRTRFPARFASRRVKR